MLNDEEIVESVVENQTCDDSEQLQEEEQNSTEEASIPSHSDVLSMLTQCLPWVEQQPETTPTQIFIFTNLMDRKDILV